MDHQHNLDQLALFAGADDHAVFKLPYLLPEGVVLHDTVLTRDQVFAVGQTGGGQADPPMPEVAGIPSDVENFPSRVPL